LGISTVREISTSWPPNAQGRLRHRINGQNYRASPPAALVATIKQVVGNLCGRMGFTAAS